MTTQEFGFWRIVGVIGTLIAVIALVSEHKIESNLAHWTNAVLLIGVPLLFFLVAGVGGAVTRRLEAIETAVREKRGP